MTVQITDTQKFIITAQEVSAVGTPVVFNNPVVFTSNDPNIVSINQLSGNTAEVVAGADGVTSVTATVDSFTASVNVQVTAVATGLVLTESDPVAK